VKRVEVETSAIAVGRVWAEGNTDVFLTFFVGFAGVVAVQNFGFAAWIIRIFVVFVRVGIDVLFFGMDRDLIAVLVVLIAFDFFACGFVNDAFAHRRGVVKVAANNAFRFVVIAANETKAERADQEKVCVSFHKDLQFDNLVEKTKCSCWFTSGSELSCVEQTILKY